MARVKYGALITEIKGKVGGSVFQGGRSGGIVKNLPQGLVRHSRRLGTSEAKNSISFSQVTKGWSQLSQIQRDTWSALLGTWTFTDKFGDVYNGTPYQIFCAVNLNLLFAGLTKFTDGPAYLAAEYMNYSVPDYEIGVGWTIDCPTVTTDDQQLIISVSRPQNQTKPLDSAVYNLLDSRLWDPATPVDFSAAYTALYGTAPVAGSFFWCKLFCFVPSYPRQQFVEYFKVSVV